MDKSGNLLKFSRDLDSDWVVKNNKPHYGLKEHASVDTNHGFVLSTDLTPASVNDSIYLPHCIAAQLPYRRFPLGRSTPTRGIMENPTAAFYT